MLEIIVYYIVMRSRVSLVNLQVLGMDSVIYGANCAKIQSGWKLELQIDLRALVGRIASARTCSNWRSRGFHERSWYRERALVREAESEVEH